MTLNNIISKMQNKKVCIFTPISYIMGTKRSNSLPVQYWALGSLISKKGNGSKFVLQSSFDILIECNKSPFTKSSLRSTIRELKKFPEVSGPDNSHELSMAKPNTLWIISSIIKIASIGWWQMTYLRLVAQIFSGCEGQVEHSVWEDCGGNCNQCIQQNGFCSDCKVGQQDSIWKLHWT